MSLLRWLALAVLLALPGCDVGTAVVLMSKDKGGSDDDTPATIVPVVPGPEFTVAVAYLPDDAAGDAAYNDLIASGGNPNGPTWGEIGAGTATTVLNPTVPPATINTVLIKATALQNFRLDSLEILDAQGSVVGHASQTPWSNLVTQAGDILGPPDGASAETAAVDGTSAFIFTRYVGPIDQIRINAQAVGGPASGGNVLAVGGYPSNYNQKPGGMAIHSNGLIHLTLTDKDDVRLVRYGLDAVLVDETQIDGSVEQTYGSHCVALDPNGYIVTAACKADGKVIIRSYFSNLSQDWSRTIYSGKDSDRVEANGIAVDGSGNVVVAGGLNTSNQGLNHWLAKLDGGTGSIIWSFVPGGDTADTYWRAVTTGPGDLIYTTGNQTSGLFDVVQILTGRFSPAGAGQWEDLFGDTDAPDDSGNAVARDSAGNLYMGGFAGTSPEGRNGVLLKYANTGVLSDLTSFNGLAGGDDEILDIAVDADGSIYAVGYETVTGQGQNWWVRKYDANLEPVWTRTHDGGVGDDRAISVAIKDDQLVVAGYQTVSGGLTKFVLRVYAK